MAVNGTGMLAALLSAFGLLILLTLSSFVTRE
jgi:hypothetical protein